MAQFGSDEEDPREVSLILMLNEMLTIPVSNWHAAVPNQFCRVLVFSAKPNKISTTYSPSAFDMANFDRSADDTTADFFNVKVLSMPKIREICIMNVTTIYFPPNRPK